MVFGITIWGGGLLTLAVNQNNDKDPESNNFPRLADERFSHSDNDIIEQPQK